VKEVNHLKGGIHKYLEEFGGNEELWKGRNFVFDGRGAASAVATKLGKNGSCQIEEETLNSMNNIVGRCVDCDAPFDSFDPHCVCTVCREPTLVCLDCQHRLAEYHCRSHSHLRFCYFSDLERFTADELGHQLGDLLETLTVIAVGRRFRQKRKTLQKQIDRVRARIRELQTASVQTDASVCADRSKCRNCGDTECTGRCWGFFGLKRKEMLEKQKDASDGTGAAVLTESTISKKHPHLPKKLRRDDLVAELVQLNASMPPNAFRDPTTGIRVPPCTTRLLQCTMKAKWCGQSVLRVVQNEFAELGRPEVMQDVLANGLLRLNGRPISASEVSELQLKSSDTLGRIVHWHEAPVRVPACIGIQKFQLPSIVLEEYGSGDDDDGLVYVCDKPSSVPVHPAGPYLANSLTMMVEAQEGLLPQSLNPLHRTDRVTSGLTLCCTSSAVSRAFHKSLTECAVDKLYLARVCGKFPASAADAIRKLDGDVGRCSWSEVGLFLTVDAPVHTVDVAAGIRSVDADGKPSQSLFRLLAYDGRNDTSLISCFPVTGRNHQLRVHLQWLGFPIVNDVQYGGRLEIDHTGSIEHSASVLAMLGAMESSNSERKVESLSDADVLAAKRACPCCRGGGREGILNSFTPAQLLCEGHAICLHALRYRVRILPRKKTLAKGDGSSMPTRPVAELDFQVGPPEWADQEALRKLEWLGR
jgi:23S rRNA-/tRNA-specific pseudouridylate synthase